jgi:hypothetical protein
LRNPDFVVVFYRIVIGCRTWRFPGAATRRETVIIMRRRLKPGTGEEPVPLHYLSVANPPDFSDLFAGVLI